MVPLERRRRARAVWRRGTEESPGRRTRAAEGVPRLEAIGITKDFATLRANDHVDFAIQPGEIHALLGENGAGKSTLVQILYGSLQPTEGEIRWNGAPVTIANPAAARRLGIGMVFQHFSLFEALTVAENISLALSGEMSLADLKPRITKVSAEYGLPLNPDARSRTFPWANGRGSRSCAACCRAAAHHHGRADVGADAAGGGRSVRDAEAAGERGRFGSLSLRHGHLCIGQ